MGESGCGFSKEERLRKRKEFLGVYKRGDNVQATYFVLYLLENRLPYNRLGITVSRKIGKIEYANGGTLFLDEIGDMPLPLQAKILHFLQEKRIVRLGGNQEISLDIRVICATHQDLGKRIDEGLFREDLYYRISEIVVEVPPLRERGEDIILLAQSFLNKFTTQENTKANSFSQEAKSAIHAFSWPGNIRELENKIKGAIIMADGKHVTAADLGLETVDDTPPSVNLREVRKSAESEAIRHALVHTSGNISKASKLLGITRPTLYDLMEKYEIDPAVG